MLRSVQNQKQPQKRVSSSLARSKTAVRGLYYRTDPIVNLQRAIRNQAVQRMLRTDTSELDRRLTATALPRPGACGSRTPIDPRAAGAVQTNLAINKPGDEDEQEADRVSERLIRMFEPQQHACAGGGECPTCLADKRDGEHERLQTKQMQSSDLEQTTVPAIVHKALRSPGQPLDAETRAFMEPRLGYDFSGVRVHTDELAARSAEAVSAHAYTVGPDVVFGSGRYAPTSRDGQCLIAHELAHVVQQNALPSPAAVVQRQYGGEGGDADAVAEREYGGSGAPKAQTC